MRFANGILWVLPAVRRREQVFEDRFDAGRQLAGKLMETLDCVSREDALVLALPRGGVAVAYEVARVLEAPLDVIVARKVGAPMQQELGIGAVAPGGVRIIDDRLARRLGISEADIDPIVERETAEMERRQQLYRGDAPAIALAGRTVILVDDGLATGISARAACRSIRGQKPRRLILAVPVCAPQSVESMRGEADEIVCVLAPQDFSAVGAWYHDFDQTSDEQVLDLLARTREAVNPPAADKGITNMIPGA